jgi:hypothetical protein
VELRFTETIHAPHDRVFALSSDIDRSKEWLPAGVIVEKLTPGPTRAGTRYRETRKILGRKDTEEYEVTLFEPPFRTEVTADGRRGTAGRGIFRFLIEFAAESPGSTRVVLCASVTRLGCLGLLAYPLVRNILKRHSLADLAGLKRWIEQEER